MKQGLVAVAGMAAGGSFAFAQQPAGGESRFFPGFKTFKVRALVENSPATQAGFKVGDTIISIDGRSTGDMTLDQIRSMFRQEGRSYSLSAKRGESVLSLMIKTRRLI